MDDPQSFDSPGAPRRGFDSELDLKSIIVFVVGLAAVLVLVLAVMWGMSALFKKAEERRDPARSPLPEARVDPIPPGPRLQSTPPRDMDELRAQDRRVLTTYGWVDQTGGVARIPIDRAKAMLLEKGVGAVREPPKEAK